MRGSSGCETGESATEERGGAGSEGNLLPVPVLLNVELVFLVAASPESGLRRSARQEPSPLGGLRGTGRRAALGPQGLSPHWPPGSASAGGQGLPPPGPLSRSWPSLEGSPCFVSGLTFAFWSHREVSRLLSFLGMGFHEH